MSDDNQINVYMLIYWFLIKRLRLVCTTNICTFNPFFRLIQELTKIGIDSHNIVGNAFILYCVQEYKVSSQGNTGQSQRVVIEFDYPDLCVRTIEGDVIYTRRKASFLYFQHY